MDGKLYLSQFVVASICPVFYSLFNLFDSIDYRLLLEKRIWWLEDAKNYGNRSEKKKGFEKHQTHLVNFGCEKVSIIL